jgi:4-hydroxy-tetrahydrodipicolinate reductase
MTIKVAVTGADGRMGRTVCAAVEAAPDLELVARVDEDASVADAVGSAAQVLVDFTRPDVSPALVREAVAAGLHCVVGTSGYDASRLDDLRTLLVATPKVGVVVAPNFALGAVLLQRFAEQAARHFESVEIIELHHPDKVDAPSGTAVATAEAIARARAAAGLGPVPDATTTSRPGARGADVEGVPVHAVRLRGLTAHEEVLFGGPGESLTLRHDSHDRLSFMPGVLLAVRSVTSRPGLTVGLGDLLDASS